MALLDVGAVDWLGGAEVPWLAAPPALQLTAYLAHLCRLLARNFLLVAAHISAGVLRRGKNAKKRLASLTLSRYEQHVRPVGSSSAREYARKFKLTTSLPFY